MEKGYYKSVIIGAKALYLPSQSTIKMEKGYYYNVTRANTMYDENSRNPQ